jgi:LmbE family N-acetylglucosaminyl deacetylase
LVVLAPHPDDFDAIGITLRFFRDNGNRIDVAVVTSGASGVLDEFFPGATAMAKAEIREKEQRASCQFFGLPESSLTFLRLKEDEQGHPRETGENVARVRQHLAARRPDLVFLPHGNDANAGHRRTYSIFHKIASEEVHPLVALLGRDPKTIQMRHDLYATFGPAEAEWKGQLLRFHQSQHHRNLKSRGHGIDDRILRLNRKIAEEMQGNAMYAEVFELEPYGVRDQRSTQQL